MGEGAAIEQDPRHEANRALDTIVQELNDKGSDLNRFAKEIAMIRQAVKGSKE